MSGGSRHVEVEPGLQVFVEDVGAGKPIVLVHGWPFDHRQFEYQLNVLAQRGYRCVALDLRGFGQSDKPYIDHTYDAFADDLGAVLDALSLEDATLVGFSMGAAVAVRYTAREAARRVARLVLLAPTTPVMTRREGFPYLGERSQMDAWVEGIKADRPQAVANAVKFQFHQEGSISPEFAEWMRGAGMAASPKATVDAFAEMRDADLRPDLVEIETPTLIMHAVEDQIAPFALAEHVHARITGSKLIRLERGVHGVFYDERKRVNEELIRFTT